jgi:kynurenine formamidase
MITVEQIKTLIDEEEAHWLSLHKGFYEKWQEDTSHTPHALSYMQSSGRVVALGELQAKIRKLEREKR